MDSPDSPVRAVLLQLTAPQRVRIPNIGDPEYVGRIARTAVGDRQAHELGSFVFGWCTATDQNPAARRIAMMSGAGFYSPGMEVQLEKLGTP